MRIFIFLSLITLISKAQIGDSLLEQTLEIKNDTERVNQLYQKGFSLRNSDPFLSFQYADYCEKNALISGSPKHIAKSYNLLGVLYYKKGDFKKAIKYHEKALLLRINCADLLGKAHSYTNLGNVYSDLNLFSKAENNYLMALQAYKDLKEPKQVAKAFINLGVLKQQTGLPSVALEYYTHALQIAEELNDYDIRSNCLNNLAVAHFFNGDYEKAICFNQDALKIRNLMDNNVEIADSYLNLAGNYIKLKEFKKAKSCIDTAMSISKNYDYFEGTHEALKIYSEYFSEINNFDQAYYYLKKYSAIKDSVLALKADSDISIDSNLVRNETHVDTFAGSSHKLLLLSVLVLIFIIIPFYFIRFKR